MALRTTEEVKEIVKRYYALLLKEGYPVEKVLLFGSFVMNTQHDNSDIDLAVVMRKFSKDRFNTRLELMKLAREFEEVIEPHPFLLSELDEPDPFVYEILRTGEIVYAG